MKAYYWSIVSGLGRYFNMGHYQQVLAESIIFWGNKDENIMVTENMQTLTAELKRFKKKSILFSPYF